MQVNQDVPKNLLWLDLEMTGLDPASDRIIEAAVILTGFDLTPITTYETGVRQDEAVLKNLLDNNEFWQARPTEKQEIIDYSLAGKPESQVEAVLLALIEDYFDDELVYLAGNSIHMDRRFIEQWWPKLHKRLHYRMLDVSSFKLWWLGNGDQPFNKLEKHRALADIKESIAELKYYVSK